MSYLVIDLGATRIKWAVFLNDHIADSGSYPTPADPHEVLKPLMGMKPSTITIAFAGFACGGRIAFSPNLPGYQGFPLAEFLHGETGSKVILDNDANLFALGEVAVGAGKGFGVVLGLTLGTGIGGGLVIDGKIYRGAGFALEPGHMIVDPDGPVCGCGSRGCLESLIGERVFCQRFGYESAKDAFEAGDSEAWDFYGRWLGIGIGNLINILDPQAIILGGGVAGAFDLFERSITQAIAAIVVEWQRRKTRLVRSELRDEAALWGGYYLAKASGD
ncbi:MAG: ROK family protein [candidate division WOR-3 bacterium]